MIYDHLVSAPILLCRRNAEKVYVGTARSNHAVLQEGIKNLLVKYAQQGKRVCHLKGGDPFIFGVVVKKFKNYSLQVLAFKLYPELPLHQAVQHMQVFP